MRELARRGGPVREVSYLRGFLARHRGDPQQAVRHYEAALNERYGGIAIHRELAASYLALGNLDKASEYIEKAQEKQPDNKFIVDLRIQIACRRGDERTARSLLPLLIDIDDPAFANHRAARVEYMFGTPDTAYQLGGKAIDASDRPSFEILSNYALCCLRVARVDEAARTVDRLERLYSGWRRDIQLGLRARIAIHSGRYDDALGYHEAMSDKSRPVHLAIRRDALRGLISTTYVAPSRRDEVDRELADLDARLRGFDAHLDIDTDSAVIG
jgi:tetratricopeptide (TPR) repeat protein